MRIGKGLRCSRHKQSKHLDFLGRYEFSSTYARTWTREGWGDVTYHRESEMYEAKPENYLLGKLRKRTIELAEGKGVVRAEMRLVEVGKPELVYDPEWVGEK